MSAETVAADHLPPDKISAFEVAGMLARPERNPGMQRPLTISVGAALVLSRMLAGIIMLVVIWFEWNVIMAAATEAVGKEAMAAVDSDLARLVVIAGGALLCAFDGILAFFVWRGRNLARVLVMILSVVSVSSSFATWWAQDQELTLQSSLLPLALDVLILLALSSRSAAAYARRNERRGGRDV